jgi:hypothetical protein
VATVRGASKRHMGMPRYGQLVHVYVTCGDGTSAHCIRAATAYLYDMRLFWWHLVVTGTAPCIHQFPESKHPPVSGAAGLSSPENACKTLCAHPAWLLQLTAICFDKNERRLVTAGGDGSVVMWNFNNGSKLRRYAHSDAKEEISTVCKSMNRSLFHINPMQCRPQCCEACVLRLVPLQLCCQSVLCGSCLRHLALRLILLCGWLV